MIEIKVMPIVDASNLVQFQDDSVHENKFDSLKFVLDSLENFDDNITQLDFSRYTLEEFPKDCLLRFKNLTRLNLAYNHLTELPELPDSLLYLNIDFNLIQKIEKLPPRLEEFYFNLNGTDTICELPNSIKYMNCYGNQLTEFKNLPTSLIILDCHNNKLTKLPLLPLTITTLFISSNNLTELPQQELPNLEVLWVDDNKLTHIDLKFYKNVTNYNGANNPWVI
jgi:Leucine-rich repeat (LRR) protein